MLACAGWRGDAVAPPPAAVNPARGGVLRSYSDLGGVVVVREEETISSGRAGSAPPIEESAS